VKLLFGGSYFITRSIYTRLWHHNCQQQSSQSEQLCQCKDKSSPTSPQR